MAASLATAAADPLRSESNTGTKRRNEPVRNDISAVQAQELVASGETATRRRDTCGLRLLVSPAVQHLEGKPQNPRSKYEKRALGAGDTAARCPVARVREVVGEALRGTSEQI